MLGVKPILCQTYPEAAFVLFLECCTPLITPKTKATSLVLVAPNNSTGAIYSPAASTHPSPVSQQIKAWPLFLPRPTAT
ncbi:uncharacterized protein STEHIDRAFT_163378 [Stereum hirsutum FP-91666 SS1]|uniref:Uncharacterized protein n=1 Tax=Stereum hirsutum (strain FP-91666) TaxID=721885 RepID=R7RWW2_STEHR|nr:uncharacterized protein STEHIDRAFT_163378 [Stereum hirsutum FP-91666 SS1]EIM79819.1 hypothetical protein STEHIDRAFT_163378 [Stereum hirsutum FP-91666 SS1]